MNIFSNGINYADGETPTVMSANIEAIGYEGWYYMFAGPSLLPAFGNTI
jgi:hypothetical protein